MEINCHYCYRHCSIINLHCPRGKDTFQQKEAKETRITNSSMEEKIIILLRRCTHFLHYYQGNKNLIHLLTSFDVKKQHELILLLEKYLHLFDK